MMGMMLLTLALSAPARSSDTAPVLDGHYLPLRTEAAYSFECRETSLTLRYAQKRLPLGSVGGDPARALGAELLELNAGRDIADRDRQAVASLFESLAWVESVTAQCFEGTVAVTLRGMPLRAWADFVTDKTEERPRAPLRTIRVDASGEVTIR